MTIDREKKQYINKKSTTRNFIKTMEHEDIPEVEEALAKTLEDVLVATEVPACNEVQCGWAASHSLEGAQMEAKKFLEKRSEWKNVFSK